MDRWMASSTMFDEEIKVHVFVANICTSLVEFQIYMMLCVFTYLLLNLLKLYYCIMCDMW